jgi:hypothetical protein
LLRFFFFGILRNGKYFRHKNRVCGAGKHVFAANVSERKFFGEKIAPGIESAPFCGNMARQITENNVFLKKNLTTAGRSRAEKNGVARQEVSSFLRMKATQQSNNVTTKAQAKSASTPTQRMNLLVYFLSSKFFFFTVSVIASSVGQSLPPYSQGVPRPNVGRKEVGPHRTRHRQD